MTTARRITPGPSVDQGVASPPPPIRKRRKNWVESLSHGLKNVTPVLLMTLLTAGFGSPFLIGYNTGVINAVQPVLVDWIRHARCVSFLGAWSSGGVYSGLDIDQNSTIRLWCHPLNTSEGDHILQTNPTLGYMWYGLNVLFSIGGLVGALLSQYVVQVCGRKGCLLVNNACAVGSALLQGFAYTADSYVMLIVGRTIAGINAGISTAVAPVYFMDMVPSALSGALGALQRLFDVLGTLIAQILGLPTLLGGVTSWPYLLGFSLFPAVIQLLILPFAPEDPKYLADVQDDEPGAETALAHLRGSHEYAEELNQLRQEHVKAGEEPSIRFLDLLRDKMLRTVTLVGLFLISSRQFTGINAAYFFSTDIFEGAGLKGLRVQYATIGVGATLFVATLITACLVEKVGRRGLMLFGLGGITLVCSALAGFITSYQTTADATKMKVNETQPSPHWTPTEFNYTSTDSTPLQQSDQQVAWTSYAAMGTFFVYLIVYSFGPGTIPSFMITEMYTQKQRSVANSAALGMHWFGGTVVAVVFPIIQSAIRGYVFVVFAGLTVVYFFFVLFKVPETKGKKTEDIQSEIRSKNSYCC